MIIAYMFILHFVADFIFQSREMGQKKSSEFIWLAKHLAIQTAFFLFGLMIVVNPLIALKIALLNSLIHGVIDWNIWRLYKASAYYRIKKEADAFTISQEEKNKWMAESGKNWQYWNDHLFYTTIGFDQLLHGLTILAMAGLFL